MAVPLQLRGTRLAIARLLLDGPMTARQMGIGLGKPTGSYFGVLTRMHAEGLVSADPDPPVRGSVYELADAVRDALGASAADDESPGVVESGQRLLVVARPFDPLEVQQVLANASLSGVVVWAAEVGGGWLLALSSAMGNSFPMQQLEIALRGAGAQTSELAVGDLLTGRELRDRAAWLSETAGRS